MDFVADLAPLAIPAAAALVVWTQMRVKKAEPLEAAKDAATCSKASAKRRTKQRAMPKQRQPEAFKWDAPPAKKESEGESPAASGKAKRKEKFNPVAAGEKMIGAAVKPKKEEEKARPSEKQKNRLFSQGFVAVPSKPEKAVRRRASSASSVGPTDDDSDEYAGMSPEAAERLKLLEMIASGKRIGGDGYAGRDARKKTTTVGQERHVDHDTVRLHLDKQKKEKLEKQQEKTKARGGRVTIYQSPSPSPAAGMKVAHGMMWAPAAPRHEPSRLALPTDSTPTNTPPSTPSEAHLSPSAMALPEDSTPQVLQLVPEAEA